MNPPPRYLVGSPNSDHFLAVTKNNATLCRALEPSLLSSFPLFEDTDCRLAFSIEADVCIVGSWSKGLVCYSLSTGATAWRNSRIIGFTAIEVNPVARVVLVTGLESASSVVLDLASGAQVRLIEGVQKAFLNPQGDTWVYLTAKSELRFEHQPTGQSSICDWPSFTVLSAAFGGGRFFASSPRGHLASYDLEHQRLNRVATFEEKVSNFRPVCYIESLMQFHAVAFDYGGEAQCALFAFEPDLESWRVLQTFASVFAAVFLSKGAMMLTTTGEIYSTLDGTLCSKITWKV